jgi:hypothetical protein
MTIAVWPVISSALARTPHATLSLAAWPVALSIWWLLDTPLQMLQQVVIPALKNGVPGHVVRQTATLLGVSTSLLLAAISISPLLSLFVHHVIAAPPDLASAVVAAVLVMAPLPLLAALRAFLQGKLIVSGRTHHVRSATGLNLAVLVLVLLAGTNWIVVEAILLAAGAPVLSSSAELLLLYRFTRVP